MMMMDFSLQDLEKIDKVVGGLKKSKNVFLVTGAGVSVDSGLPTYRGVGGLYEDKVTEEGIPIETALAGEMLKAHPEVTWKYLSHIEGGLRQARYNRAHAVMAEMEKCFDRVCILTQNIDGFHHAAGSTNILDIHGDIHRVRCDHCLWRRVIRDFSEIEIPPRCPSCGKTARPDVVFFGEMLPQDKLARLWQELQRGFDIYFSVGTTSVFPYIQEPMIEARRRGKMTVEINPGETAISPWVDVKLSSGAAQTMEAIWDRFRKK